MNKTFQTVTSVLIIILLFLLVWVFVSYYTEPSSTNTIDPIINVNSNVQSPIDKEIIDSSKQDDELNNDNQPQQDNVSDVNIEIDTPTTTIVEKVEENVNKNEGSSVIISSDPNISNSDKQQVLTQIDEALSELLVVVDSVTTVDETRLGIDEEVEVQQ
ncbi:MAG: hypothetical protein J6B87_00460 [Clostridia bacterium]|nr:hypothetical protein [Clostridia bacterium]